MASRAAEPTPAPPQLRDGLAEAHRRRASLRAFLGPRGGEPAVFQTWGYASFLALALALLGVAWHARHVQPDPGLFAIVVAALGGLLHEVIQSGGVLLAPRHVDGNLYLGSLTGIALGAFTGLTAVAVAPPLDFALVPALAGFSVKGAAEAAVSFPRVHAALRGLPWRARPGGGRR